MSEQFCFLTSTRLNSRFFLLPAELCVSSALRNKPQTSETLSGTTESFLKPFKEHRRDLMMRTSDENVVFLFVVFSSLSLFKQFVTRIKVCETQTLRMTSETKPTNIWTFSSLWGLLILSSCSWSIGLTCSPVGVVHICLVQFVFQRVV